MEEFVSQLLPTHAFNKLKQFSLNDKMDLTDEFEEVTILFADIKGFTNYSNSVVPE
jgi:phospholipid-translocating ATPase